MSLSAFLRERRRLFLLFLTQVGAGSLAQRLENLGKRKNSLPGRLIETGGCKLNIVAMGQPGTPAVVFEADSGGWSVDWAALQGEVSAFARAVTYDRAGHGRSEPARRPRTLFHMIEELRALLYNANIKHPYVLVGRGFGGLLAEYFARFYPEETAGLVLVGTMTLEEVVRAAGGELPVPTGDKLRMKQMRSKAYRNALKDQNKRITEASAGGLQKQLESAGPLPEVPVIKLRADVSDPEISAAVRKILPQK